MKFLLGIKEYMTQVADESGQMAAATVVAAGPISVTGIKTPERDGYYALQFGYGKGKSGFKHLREYRLPKKETPENLSVGQVFDASVFAPGDRVSVSGKAKGKGFQGVVKRHGFAGGPRTHGQKHAERKPGSIGGGLRTRVPKGMRMAGRMGGGRVTVRDLKILQIDKENNRLVVAGAIPGRRGALLEIKSYGSESL